MLWQMRESMLRQTLHVRIASGTQTFQSSDWPKWCFTLWFYVISCIFMPPPFEEWWRGIKCYPCPCVRAFVRVSVCPSVRPSAIKIWCPLNNFWKTASIWFIFGMLISYIKTQVKFDLGYNPLIFDGVMGLL